MAVPKQILNLMHLEAGSLVELYLENGKLIVEPKLKPRYTLSDLLAQCNEENMLLTQEDHAWLNAKPVGKEAL
jgi:antitoxin ChpS